jgi:hypothetical protein
MAQPAGPRRMRAAGAGVASGHLLLGATGALVLAVPGAMLFFGLCAGLSLALALAAAPLLRPRPPRDDDRPPGEPGTGPQPPPWWPEFERAFRECAQEAGRPCEAGVQRRCAGVIPQERSAA